MICGDVLTVADACMHRESGDTQVMAILPSQSEQFAQSGCKMDPVVCQCVIRHVLASAPMCELVVMGSDRNDLCFLVLLTGICK